MLFHAAEKSAARFRGGLAPRDQRIIDTLFTYAHRHIAPAAYAAHPMPMQIFLLAMILEEHKQVMEIREWVTAEMQRRGIVWQDEPEQTEEEDKADSAA